MPRRQKRPTSTAGRAAKKAIVLSLRIDEATNRELESAANRRGHTRSREGELRLRRTLDLDRLLEDAFGPPHIRALAILVSRLVAEIEGMAGPSWRTHPFISAAVLAGVRMLIVELSPKGEMHLPQKLKKLSSEAGQPSAVDDPKAMGEWAAFRLLSLLARLQRAPTADDAELLGDRDAMFAGDFYLFPQLRQDLGLVGPFRDDGETR
jgi:hypothetical protein